jgi:hypothetical protein
VFLPTSSPKPFTLTTSTASATTTSSRASSSVGLAGRWLLAAGSQAGYRVREQLSFLPAQSDAVGRASSITDDATLARSGDGVTIPSASINVAVNTLKSDRSVGSLLFPWKDFGMTAPSIGGFVTVTDKAAMEFDLRLQRA